MAALDLEIERREAEIKIMREELRLAKLMVMQRTLCDRKQPNLMNEEGFGQQSAVNPRYLGRPSMNEEGLGHQSAVNPLYLGRPSVNEEGLGQQRAVNPLYLGRPSMNEEGLGHQSAVNPLYLGEPSTNEEGLGQQCVVWRTSTTFNENGAANVRPSADADNLDSIVHGQCAVNLGGDENTWTESVWTDISTGKLEWTTAGQCVVSNGGDDGASKKIESAKAGDSSSNQLELTAHDRRVVATSAVSVFLSLVPPVETGERAVATPGVTTLPHLPSVKTDTSSGGLERTAVDLCAVSNGGENGTSKNMESVCTDISSGESKRTVFDQFVIADSVLNGVWSLRPQIGAFKLTGAAGETDYSSNLESVEADTSSVERDQTMVDQFVVTNSEGDGARLTTKVEKLSGKFNRTDLDQCVVTKCIVNGAPSPVAPIETGEMAVTTPRARILSVLESVWTDTLSGELERTRSDQCVISNGGDDGVSKKFESAEADTSIGELERTIHDPCEIAGRVINSSEAVSLRTPVEAGALTGKAKEPETITTDVGLTWTSPDGRTMKITDWSRAGFYLQLFWRTGIGWLDEVVSLLTERWRTKYRLCHRLEDVTTDSGWRRLVGVSEPAPIASMVRQELPVSTMRRGRLF
jgi:hypothetical protein